VLSTRMPSRTAASLSSRDCKAHEGDEHEYQDHNMISVPILEIVTQRKPTASGHRRSPFLDNAAGNCSQNAKIDQWTSNNPSPFPLSMSGLHTAIVGSEA
jgi:hypothetical protein